MRHLLFVYGTLRPGEPHHGLLAPAEYLGPHRTGPHYTMLDLGGFPGIVVGGDTEVVGDVFAVDADVLSRLDTFEEHPHEYTRTQIATPFGGAWVYIYRHRPQGARTIASGDWRRR